MAADAVADGKDRVLHEEGILVVAADKAHIGQEPQERRALWPVTTSASILSLTGRDSCPGAGAGSGLRSLPVSACCFFEKGSLIDVRP